MEAKEPFTLVVPFAEQTINQWRYFYRLNSAIERCTNPFSFTFNPSHIAKCLEVTQLPTIASLNYETHFGDGLFFAQGWMRDGV
jgi:hypothetical protein